MYKHSRITNDRIRRFIEFELRETIVDKISAVEAELLISDEPSEAAARKSKNWKKVQPGDKWGPSYQFGWYRVQGKVPTAEPGFSVALMYGKTEFAWQGWWGPDMVEATIFEDGSPIAALDFAHPYYRLDASRKTIDFLLQTYARNKETTVDRPEQPRTPEPEDFKGFWFCRLDEEKLQLFFDCEFAFDLMKAHEEDDAIFVYIQRALNEVCNTYDADNRKTWAKCRKIIQSTLGELNSELHHTITPVGHAHLDTAWLWPLSVTHLKMAHTSAAQLELMDRYPEHVFAHSQASQYDWIEREHPELFKRIQRQVKRGQWEVVGSMWVEADCNLTGAESLIRQFLYGKRYFRQKFGVETVDMWLPDVFGYCAALPQILEKFSINHFLTQKMSWNSTNKIPHNTFWWQGIDGTRVWAHFPPADTYVHSCAPSDIIKSVKNHRDKARSDRSLLLFGFGDGGGGPTEWHLERLRRARTAPGMPELEKKETAKSFFERAREESRDLMTWRGELYLEFHRGTYTSQAKNKRFNRQCEFLLRDAEYLNLFRDDYAKVYPQAELEDAWKLVLLNQFHDIIPGSSVREVYEDSDKDYAEVISIADKHIESAMKRISSQMTLPEPDKSEKSYEPLAIFHHSDVASEVKMPWTGKKVPTSLKCGDESLPVQLVEEGGEQSLIFETPINAMRSVAVASLSDEEPLDTTRLKVAARRMENDEFVVKFDANGNITSIQTLDDDPTEFIEAGKLANLFQIMDDKPNFWDAWDTELFAQETIQDLVKSESFEVVEKGPVRVAVELVKKFGKSTIRQRISLGPTPGIRFDTEVDWHEDHKFLKVAFPLNVNSDRATYEIQYGHVERPTHRNTSWDQARFEVCAQKWADLSEGGHGVALINTGKYGYDCHENVLRLSLLRAPKAPDPICDRGVHKFSYVLLPHFDQVQHSMVIQSAYAINAEPRVCTATPKTGDVMEVPPYVDVDTRSITIECVKKAEDSNRRVVRMYECLNTRGMATLSSAMPIKRAWITDLEENVISEAEVVDGMVTFGFTPFEIITMKLEM
ncbi:MAG: glycoside hydrolase family 38 C-terminal domain-containing protein [Fimbriimonadaceae bacterium]